MTDFHKKAKTDKPYNQGKIVSNSTGGGDDFSTRSSNPTVHNPVSKQTLTAPGGNAPMPPHGQSDQNTLASFSGSPNKKHFLHGGPCKGKAETLAYWTIDQGQIMGKDAALKDPENLDRILKQLQGESADGKSYMDEIMPPLSYMNADHPVGGEEQHEAAAVAFASLDSPLFWGGGIGFLMKYVQGELEGKCGCWVSLGGFIDLFTMWLGKGTSRAIMKKLGIFKQAKDAARAALFKKASTMAKYNTALSSNWATRWNTIIPGGIGGITNGMIVNPARASTRNSMRVLTKKLNERLLAIAKNQNLSPTIKEQYRQLKALGKEWDDFVSEINRKKSIMDADVEKVWRYHTFQEGVHKLTGDPLFTSYQSAWAEFSKVFVERMGVFLTALVQRPKQCYGNNTFLNPDTCECECVEGGTQCGFLTRTSATGSSPLTGPVTFGGFIDSTIDDTIRRTNLFLDFINPNFLPQTNELKSCEIGCPCNLTHTSYTGVCKCTACLGGYTWKTGGVCHCAKDAFLIDVFGRGSWGKEHGQCVDDDVDSKETALGKTWDGKEICGYVCPAGSDVIEGRTMPSLARLQDNLSDSGVPTKQHYLYRTGCNYVCDGRDRAEGTPWPPTCDTGSTFDASKNVCACRPNDGFCCGICTKADSPSGGASCDGCTGCCIYDPASGVAGWDGYYCLTYTVTGSPTGDDCYGCEFSGTPDSEGSCKYLESTHGDCT